MCTRKCRCMPAMCTCKCRCKCKHGKLRSKKQSDWFWLIAFMCGLLFGILLTYCFSWYFKKSGKDQALDPAPQPEPLREVKIDRFSGERASGPDRDSGIVFLDPHHRGSGESLVEAGHDQIVAVNAASPLADAEKFRAFIALIKNAAEQRKNARQRGVKRL